MKTRLNLAGITLVLLALFGSLPSASAYYDPGVQRWLNRDPLGDVAFPQQQISNKPKLGQVRPIAESLMPSYVFLENSPAASIDPLGLDRWFMMSPLHAGIVVEKWNSSCDCVTGYEFIEFGPGGFWPVPLINCTGVVVITPYHRPHLFDFKFPYPYESIHYESPCEADKELHSWAIDMRLDPPNYSLPYYNCWYFAQEALNVGVVFPASKQPFGPP